MNIKLEDDTFRKHYVILPNVHIVLRTFTYPVDFIILEILGDDFCPIIFGRPFVNTARAKIDCKREVFSLRY